MSDRSGTGRNETSVLTSSRRNDSGAILDRAEAHADERNILLRSLPAELYAELIARADTVPLTLNDCVQSSDTAADYVYFPQSGMISTVVVMQNGVKVEILTAGRDGMSPTFTATGGHRCPHESFVQAPGVARRITVADFTMLASPGSPLEWLAQQFAQAAFAQVGQAVACNRLHSVEQRCARWLLTTHDRMESDTFSLTHEYLAMMLGVRRAGVSVAAEALQAAGLIRYSRGRITILDRRGLEGAACECYGRVRDEYERLLGSAALSTEPSRREQGVTDASEMREDVVRDKRAGVTTADTLHRSRPAS